MFIYSCKCGLQLLNKVILWHNVVLLSVTGMQLLLCYSLCQFRNVKTVPKHKCINHELGCHVNVKLLEKFLNTFFLHLYSHSL